ncbi:protein-L-isoaspartate O-methyltransferase [Leminorella grimontii]|uniref:Protein-L-isoaspartate O-methyltransferase n=1 Tax=Leminorella grimontii TaxID=82981 RepID=A0AAV5N8H5_9GAMM|nr:protein-L-isoaspartate(D-aspartate) O-methyltransferase [Leminorella grimontii]GKX57027.1 protein-L-isoaspartate O-methyltransferase [Leminorella grimontii]GKX58853.1 protein-L-isoaspartate O-methyltransferase [Leminorella grimontii]VFS57275.1 Protein-L-isoaspartate O-methyltransferase [Leminorella grimontii]
MPSKRVQTMLKQLVGQGIRDERVLQALASVPRERFIDEALSHQAYDNTALPIGAGQTISQPYIVAKMTELLKLTPDSTVLEIGTGSGYQTAVLANLARHVYSVERIKSLQWQAKRRLKQLDLHNVSTRHGDGWEGWAVRGPFDAIIVTAAPDEIPQSLIEQLADGGRMVLPVGEPQQSQLLQLVQRQGDRFVADTIEMVRFVPMLKGDLA